MKNTLLHLYALVKDSRKVLFEYCDTVKQDDFVREVEGFGRGGSMRNLIVHVANSYQYWIVAHCFGEQVRSLVFEEYANLSDCRRLYDTLDEQVYRLISSFENGYYEEVYSVNGGKTFLASPFKVFTHVTTHEYHHKGQVLSISRHLGYVPVDTDVIR